MSSDEQPTGTVDAAESGTDDATDAPASSGQSSTAATAESDSASPPAPEANSGAASERASAKSTNTPSCDSDSVAETDTTTETSAAAETDTTTETSAAAEPDSATETERAAEAEPDTAVETAPGVDSAAETETTTEADTAADTKTAAEAAPDTAAGSDAASPDGTAKKKKRRRRRKKKPGEAEAASGGATAPSERNGKPQRKPKPKPERPSFTTGDMVFGVVTKVTRDSILLNVAGKAMALFDRAELIQIPPKEGEKFTGTVKSCSQRGGMLVLGREAFDTAASRTELREAVTNDQPLDCWVTGIIKGGLEVDYKGVRAFAPASHVALNPGADLSHMLGEKIPFFVTHYAKKGRDVVVSRKKLIEEDYQKVRDEQLAKLPPDTVCKGVVRNVLAWGAFVALPDYSNIEGVVHMSEASHARGARLDQVLKPGEEIDVKVLRVDDKGKLWLSRKATLEDPWQAANEKYAVGSIHNCKVVRLTEFGAFLQLEPGIDGLCHVSDLSFEQVEHPRDVLNEGDMMDILIAAIDNKERKLTLHPAPPEDERDTARLRIKQYMLVNVEVMQIKDSGLGVRIIGATGRQRRGYIPAGQTGTPRGTDLRKEFPLGKKLEAKIIDVDNRRGGEARLSIRALKQDAERQAYRDYRKKVQREASFGTFADLFKKS